MDTRVKHLHTYFLFPFSIDKEIVLEVHGAFWTERSRWESGLDRWLASRNSPEHDGPVSRLLGRWERSAYTRFDVDSPAYADMVFFHPFVRRIFFDATGMRGSSEGPSSDEPESMLRCYSIRLGDGNRVRLRGKDLRGRGASVTVSDLRLFMFANGVGILSIGVEAVDLSIGEALWANEMMRKVYPSSGRQRREGRVPCEILLTLQKPGQPEEIVVREPYEGGSMASFLPPLSRIITSLLYFVDYSAEEYEPVLDERMVVYSNLALDPDELPTGTGQSDPYEVLFSRLLYVDQEGDDFRYDPEFLRSYMDQHTYRRWAHRGTLYGFTSYSNVTCTRGTFDCDDHLLSEGFLIHRMFESRYYLMAVVALFYRVVLLDFAEKTALVSKRLYQESALGKLSPETIRVANDLRMEFLHFSNYWHFGELANKDEEIEHFSMMCRAYRTEPLRLEVDQEIDKMNAVLNDYFQFRNTEAINRLAMVSIILGGGAVATGFFGMNFGGWFSESFFSVTQKPPILHWLSILAVTVFALSAVVFGAFLVASNWSDYRSILVPKSWRKAEGRASSYRRWS